MSGRIIAAIRWFLKGIEMLRCFCIQRANTGLVSLDDPEATVKCYGFTLKHQRNKKNRERSQVHDQAA